MCSWASGESRCRSLVESIHAVLDRHGLSAPRLQHGDREAIWVLLTDAVRRRIDTRIGLEDTFLGPDGRRTEGNVALVRGAVQLGAGARVKPSYAQRLVR